MFVLQLNESTTREAINKLLDQDKYIGILNSSGWPTTRILSPENKAEFMQELIVQELITKRAKVINAFCRGLEILGVLTLIRKHPCMKGAFVFNKVGLKAGTLLVRPRVQRSLIAKHIIGSYYIMLEIVKILVCFD
jgi:hypothetical protein